MQKHFFTLFILIFAIIFAINLAWPPVLWSLIVFGPIFLLGVYDIIQPKHTVWRIFPVIGHFRYLFESVRPEIQQYFIEPDWAGRPLNRQQRNIVYARAKNTLDTLPYGTHENVLEVGYEWMRHATETKPIIKDDLRVTIGNDQCSQPYSASIFNISGMSFGSLSKNALLALNLGAKTGGFYHNTGEGGLSPYHLQHKGDLVWQIGTGYFSCRNPDGSFCESCFTKNAVKDSVKMIELKLSQGAKPGHGGILPVGKLTKEIAEIRNVPMGQDVISPANHATFRNPLQMCQFLQKLRKLSEGKPIGFKLCLGAKHEFMAICKAMLETNIIVDFITIDGSEGGTGAAPLAFADSVGTPLEDALAFIHNTLVGCNLRDKIKLIVAGKIVTEFDILSRLALGADVCNSGRAMMLALGCIQSLRCNTNHCPTGVTTQDPARMYGLVVKEKYKRIANYHHSTIKGLKELISAAGICATDELKPHHIYRRISTTQVLHLDEIYPFIKPGALLTGDVPEIYAAPWRCANAKCFDV